MKITVTNDHKEKNQSWEATATFDYKWDNSWLGYGGQMSMTAFGSNEQEARIRLTEELYRYQNELVKSLSAIY